MKIVFSFVLISLFVSCQDRSEIEVLNKKSESLSEQGYLINKENLTKDLMSLVNKTESLSKLVSVLKTSDGVVPLNNIKCVSDDLELVSRLDEKTNEARINGVVQVPELWFKEGSDVEKKKIVLFSFAPESNEEEWEYIKAFDLKGNIYKLDVDKDPEYSVIVLEPNGKYALKLLVELMNDKLDDLGVQVNRPVLKSSKGLKTTVLKSISLKDNKESWIKGDSEIYAICSGVVETDGAEVPQIKIIEMPYLDDENVQYNPNQIMLFWKDYDYQAANIQLFEHDSNYNYKELIGILVKGTTKIVSAATGEPMVAIVGEIATEILNVMPSEWFLDDDDYVDSFYTLMKNKEYNNLSGANNNATASFAPLYVPNNKR